MKTLIELIKKYKRYISVDLIMYGVTILAIILGIIIASFI
jgi:hypothetical protein